VIETNEPILTPPRVPTLIFISPYWIPADNPDSERELAIPAQPEPITVHTPILQQQWSPPTHPPIPVRPFTPSLLSPMAHQQSSHRSPLPPPGGGAGVGAGGAGG
jgi:hypothetical protein